jgi:hypothetical protein
MRVRRRISLRSTRQELRVVTSAASLLYVHLKTERTARCLP